MKIEIQKITPQRASEYVKKIDPAYQRKLMPHIVQNYARAMKAGHWVVSPQGIAFDTKDRLIDGMHRMYAILRSGKTVEMPVAYNVPERTGDIRTLDVLDSGKNRTISQQLLMVHGMNQPFLLASACRAIAISVGSGSFRNTTPITLSILDIYKEEFEFCVKHLMPIPRLRVGPIIAGFVLAMSYKARRRMMEEMYVGFMSGENLVKTNPAFVLRNQILMGKYISGNGASGGTAYGIRLVCATTLAALHYVQKKNIETIRYSDRGLSFFMSKQPERIKKVREACGIDMSGNPLHKISE